MSTSSTNNITTNSNVGLIKTHINQATTSLLPVILEVIKASAALNREVETIHGLVVEAAAEAQDGPTKDKLVEALDRLHELMRVFQEGTSPSVNPDLLKEIKEAWQELNM